MKFLCIGISMLAVSSFALEIVETKHLLGRTQFGVSVDELEAYAPLTREEAVERLLAGIRSSSVVPPLDWITEQRISPEIPFQEMTEEERDAFLRRRIQQTLELKAWWVAEMLYTPSQLTEVMTVFWHNHFTSELQKVRVPHLMARQDELMRRMAFGNFGELLHAMSKDAAMIVYLDNLQNVKAHPNENFARELMELFTMGEGHYTETDVKEAARAFTGWHLFPEDGSFRFNWRQHDFGKKTFLGQNGYFNGDDILDILLEQDRTAEFIVEKLWKVFINSYPDAGTVTQFAEGFRSSGYEILPLMRAILVSDPFWDELGRGSLVKSPLDMVVGTLRSTHQGEYPSELFLGIAFVSANLGQNLFDPPNVKGWEGGTDWITPASFLSRRDVLKRFLSGKMGRALRKPLAKDERSDILEWLLAVPPAGVLNEDSFQSWVQSLFLDPAYQVK